MNQHWNRGLALLLALSAVAGLSACGKQSQPQQPSTEEQQNDPATPPACPSDHPNDESAVVFTEENTVKAVTNDAGATLMNISLTVPLPDSMESARDYYTRWSADQIAAYENEQADAQEVYEVTKDQPGGFTPYTFDVGYQVMRNDGVLFSIYRSRYEDRDGPHPSTVYQAETFVTATGDRLLLDDVFTVPREQYLQRLKERIVPMMEQRSRDEGMSLYYDNIEDQLTQVLNVDNFYLTDDSLTIFFNEYDIAPYAAGTQVFTIPFTDLTDILDAQWSGC